MKHFFTDHPQSMGETYVEHLRAAMSYSGTFAKASIACFIHALFPFLFADTASNLLLTWVEKYIERIPKVDQRIIFLHQVINAKMKQALDQSDS